mgnify:FL=1
MKNKAKERQRILLAVAVLIGVIVTGCGLRDTVIEEKDHVGSENVVITETGEVIEKSTLGVPSPVKEAPVPDSKDQTQVPVVSEREMPTPVIEVDIPVQEQVITEEDQIEPQGHSLQLVFLGDSIFDNNRDGSGVPYLTAKQCNADVYNLAIGGTSASIEADESTEWTQWTSRGFGGVVNAMMKRIPADIFAGTRAGELLSNPHIDFSQTDYFIVEYGTNDFFRGVPQSDDDGYNQRSYAGALRYGVSNLYELAPGATVILCSPMYAQFFKDGFMIGDGNVTNNGNGTLFDYVGTCNYVAKEQNALFFNAYLDLGIDGYTAEDYLEDGVHLTEAGRQLYADALAKIILNYEETKNN